MSTTDQLLIPQSPLGETPKYPIIERIGRAKGIIVRVVRGFVTSTPTGDTADTSEEFDKISIDLDDLDLTDASQEEKAEVFGISVEELNDLEFKARQYITQCFALLKEEIPYGVILSYIQAFVDKDDEFAEEEASLEIVIRDPDLLEIGIENCLNALGVAEQMSHEEVCEVAICVREEVSLVGFESIMETLRINSTVVEHLEIYEIDTDYIKDNRIQAIEEIDLDYREAMSEWVDVKGELSDEEMAKYFEREKFDKRFLTTYFDTCQFGLINPELVEAAAKFDRRNPKFAKFLYRCKRNIVNHLEGKKGKRFLPENCAFTRNGTSAFRLFYDKYLSDGDKVCFSIEEYGEMTKMLKYDSKDKSSKKLNIAPPLPAYEEGMSEDLYVEKVREHVEEHKPDYLLISVVSRRGTVFPLEKISEVLRESSHKVNLILDGCQTVGRRVMDFNKIRPDVFIGSCQKGTDLGGPVGFLAIANDYIDSRAELDYNEEENGNPYMELNEDEKERRKRIYQLQWNNNQEIGTLNKTDMARFMYGVNPTALRSLCKDGKRLPKCLTMSVEEREGTNHALACNFLKLLWAINKNEENNDRIKILHPTNVYSKNGEVQEERVSNILECKIEGLHLTNKDKDGNMIKKENGDDLEEGITEIATRFGVTIQDYYDQAEEGASFRIAFHPFMNNKSLKILGFVLQECCKIAKEREVA